MLDVHGWSDLGRELNELSRSADPRRWETMGALVTDEVLHEFAIVAEPDRVADAIRDRFGGLIDRFSFYTTYDIADEVWEDVVAKLST